MGVRVVWTDLGGAAHGYYRDSERLIVLDLCLAESAEVSVLSHEIGHAHYGDVGHDPAQEARADRWAARRLIDPAEYAQAEEMVGPHPGALAMELGVSRWVVETFQSEAAAGRGWTGCAG